MPHEFKVALQTFALQRYPHNPNSDLQAWDAADRYLVDTVEAQYPSHTPVAIVHDNFGALAVALAHREPVLYCDSWMSERAIQDNLLNNHLPAAKVYTDVDALCKTHPAPTLIVGRVPKSKAQLAYLLQGLRSWADDSCVLLLAGMDKHLSRGQFELLARHFGPSEFLPGVKKARIWQAKVNKHLAPPVLNQKMISLPEYPLTLTGLPNVFSHDKLDMGTRIFLDAFKRLPEKEQVVDLACGNGVLGMAYLHFHPQSKLIFCDESYQAIQSVKNNLAANGCGDQNETCVGDGLKALPSESKDLVLCNPPFHQQQTVAKDIAYSLFKDTRRVLKKGGEFWLVANRHLGYHVVLKRMFGHCELVASNSKFVVLKVVKVRS